jgi:hypothetical protein
MKQKAQAMESLSWPLIKRAKNASEWMGSGVGFDSFMGLGSSNPSNGGMQSFEKGWSAVFGD